MKTNSNISHNVLKSDRHFGQFNYGKNSFMVLIPGPKKLIHLYVDFQSERTRSGWSSAVFGHDDQDVSLEFLPVEVAFNDEVETRIGDVEGDVEHVTDVA